MGLEHQFPLGLDASECNSLKYLIVSYKSSIFERCFLHPLWSLVCPPWKNTKIYCPVIEGVTHSTFQQHPSAPKPATTTNISCAAAGSCCSPMMQKYCWEFLHIRHMILILWECAGPCQCNRTSLVYITLHGSWATAVFPAFMRS